VKLSERDVERLARHLSMAPAAFLAEYTMDGGDEGTILRRTDAAGCVFLDGTACTVYEARPDTCQRCREGSRWPRRIVPARMLPSSSSNISLFTVRTPLAFRRRASPVRDIDLRKTARRRPVHGCDYLCNMRFDQSPPPLAQNDNCNLAA